MMEPRKAVYAGLLAQGLLLVSGCQSGMPITPITKVESRALPSDIVVRRITDQLSHILKLEPYPSGGPPPVRPLSDLWFWSVPYPTSVPGVCAADRITLYLRQASERQSGAQTPVVAEHLDVGHFYHLSAAPSAIHGKELQSDVPFADYAVCAKLDPLKTRFIQADDEDEVEQAAYWLAIAQSELTAQGSVPFSCIDDTREKMCTTGLSKLKLDDVNFVAGCEVISQSGKVTNPSSRCWELFASQWSVKIALTPDRAGATISQIEVGELVTTGDARID
jgi:hypothetical protein